MTDPRDTLTLVEKTAFMKSVDELTSIPTEALAALAARAAEVHLDRGEVLFRAGDPHRGSFLVIEGAIELQREGATVRRLGEGTVFGTPFVEAEETHPFTAVAVAPSHLLQLQPQDVVEGMLEFPEFGVAMVRTLAMRNDRLTARVLELEEQAAKLEQRLREAGVAPPADGPAPPARRRGPFGRRR